MNALETLLSYISLNLYNNNLNALVTNLNTQIQAIRKGVKCSHKVSVFFLKHTQN